MGTTPKILRLDAYNVLAASVTAELERLLGVLDKLDKDPDARQIHRLRVSARRLRTSLRSYGHLSRRHESVAELEKIVRKIGKATNTLRELDITSTWISRELKRERLLKTPGGTLLRSRLLEERAELARATRHRCLKLGQRLRKHRSARVMPAMKRSSGRPGLPFRDALSRSVLLQASALDSALQKLNGERSRESCHRLRLETKRLRYLLEPWSASLTGLEPLVTRLRRIQDILGAHHDLAAIDAHLQKLASAAGSEFLSTLATNLLGEKCRLLDEETERTLTAARGDEFVLPFLALCRRRRQEEQRLESIIAGQVERDLRRRVLVPLEAWLNGLHAAASELLDERSDDESPATPIASRLVRVK